MVNRREDSLDGRGEQSRSGLINKYVVEEEDTAVKNQSIRILLLLKMSRQ